MESNGDLSQSSRRTHAPDGRCDHCDIGGLHGGFLFRSIVKSVPRVLCAVVMTSVAVGGGWTPALRVADAMTVPQALNGTFTHVAAEPPSWSVVPTPWGVKNRSCREIPLTCVHTPAAACHGDGHPTPRSTAARAVPASLCQMVHGPAPTAVWWCGSGHAQFPRQLAQPTARHPPSTRSRTASAPVGDF
jgi:hypothetical protein